MNTTSDDARVGWVAPNCGRGTAQLIYTCLSTIFLCTYSVFHDEVYYHKRMFRRIWWMVVAIFMPEIVMLRALRQYIEARDLTDMMLLQRHWSIHHSWLTNMGGIRLIWIDPQIAESIKHTPYPSQHGELVLHPTEALRTIESPPASGPQLLWLLQRKKVDIETFPTVAEIRDKSKTSYFLKGLACFQGVWMLIILVARASQSLPISTLEISTLSYIICSFITYGLWWYKPYDIEVPIRVPCNKLNVDEEEEFKKITAFTVDNSVPPYSTKFWNLNLHLQMSRFPAYHSASFKHGILAISTVFGGIHLAAWGNDLPTVAEDYLWKACSMLSTITAPALFFIIRSYGYFSWPHQSLAGRLRWYSMFGVAGLYMLVRLTLTIEPFFALRSAHVGIYEQVKWVSLIPQVF